MAAKAEDPPAPAPISDDPPPPPPRLAAGELLDKRKDSENRDEDESRDSKRRRTTRQLALEKPKESGRENFSFDTRISAAAAAIETTPKFGSFNLSPLDLAGDDKLEERDGEKEVEGKIGI